MKFRRIFVYGLILLLVLGLFSTFGSASQYLYKVNMENYKPLKYVNSREYKFLLDPTLFSKSREEGYKLIWSKVKEIAKEEGFEVKEAEKPFKEKMSTKTYMDTEDFALRKIGYVLRAQQKYKKGKPSSFKFTAKYISTNLYKVITSDLKVKNGIKASSELEENVSPTKDGNLKSYYETAWKVKSKKGIGNTIGDWAALYPLVGKLGFPSDMKLSGKTAYSFGVVPGEVVLANGLKVEIEIEVWARSMDGAPIVAECSYTMDVPDYYNMKEELKSAEDLLLAFRSKMGDLEFPEYYKWNGSKVRVLLNLPVK